MKKMIFGLALIATCVASATTVTSANTFGVLKVTSNNKETVISVPWVKVGDGGAIDADSLVLTSNLTAGDKLFAYDTTTGKYYTWTLQTPGESWGTSSENEGKYLVASKSSLPRGTGLILVRENTETPIYLYGQYSAFAANEATSTATRSGSSTVTTLIAPPTTEAVDLNNGPSMSGVLDGDEIVLQLGTTYRYYDSFWHKYTVVNGFETPSTSDVVIPAGQGAWYVCKKASGDGVGDVTIVWNPAASNN